jgi:hypothetical protein
MIEPVRRPLGAILLIERLPADAIRVADQRKRPSLQVRQDGGANLEIVFDQLRLDDAVLGKQQLRQIRKFDLSLPHLGDLTAARKHKVGRTQSLNRSAFLSSERSLRRIGIHREVRIASETTARFVKKRPVILNAENVSRRMRRNGKRKVLLFLPGPERGVEKNLSH